MQKIPLILAYSFLIDKGYENEVSLIRNAKDKYKNYSTSLRKGKVLLNLMKSNKLLDEFIDKFWKDGGTEKGKKEIKFRDSIYIRFMEEKGVVIEDDPSGNETSGNSGIKVN